MDKIMNMVKPLGAYLPAVSFGWPSLLWLLLAVPLAIALYILLLYRRKKNAVRYGHKKLALDPVKRQFQSPH